jgi:hypothetical protein
MDITELPKGVWIADIFICAVALISFLCVAIPWTIRGSSHAKQDDREARKAGREAISAQLTLSLTGASILLAASFVVVQLGKSGQPSISNVAVTQVLLAGTAFAICAFCAVWNSALIVPLSHDHDVSLYPMTNIISGAVLFSLFAGTAFFTVALFLI